MKTGTPVRIDKRSVHFEDMEIQDGENDFHKFSFMGEHRPLPQLPCWTVSTNREVHEEKRTARLSAIQWTNKQYRPPLLPFYRNKARHFPG